MENNVIKQLSVNYKQIIIDEIALDGLEGIGIELLWKRVEKRLSTELTEKLKQRYWVFMTHCSSLSFYELPEPLPSLELLDRFTMINETSGYLEEPAEPLDGPFEYNPIEKEYGSSRFFNTRKLIKGIKSMTCVEAMNKYGNKLVVVACLEERWHALAPHMPMSCLSQMMSTNYCLLELIGKSRENGQMSVGNTNLHKIIKDSKTLFYNRKALQDLDLVKLENLTQYINGRGVKCLLIRLKRFHKPGILSMPKVGMLHNVIEYLLKAPGYCERTELLVKKGILTQKQNRRLQKTVNIFSFEEKPVSFEDHKTKKTKIVQRRKYMCLSTKSDNLSDSEEETIEPPLTCRYKVGVGLLRQAYEQFLDAGLQGLTQMQLSYLLGIEFYTARAICRIFRLRNIVREYLEDKGKQRTARFIAVVATEKVDKKYEEQKRQFQEYLVQCQSTSQSEAARTSVSDDEVPLKRIKLEKEAQNTASNDDDTEMPIEDANAITEIKVLDGFENMKSISNFQKNPTLRQLKFANGILKVLKEKLCITGYMTLSTLASKEVNEPPMDTKALKSFIQKLVTDGHIKLYKIKWPGLQKYSILICAYHIKMSDPVIKGKYKEICLRAVDSKKVNAKKESIENPAKIKRSYPRYMKIQKLHEFVMSVAYFEYIEPESHSLPQGFISAIDLFPEATIEFLINNLCTSSAVELYQLVTESQLSMKLKDAPSNIYQTLMKSKIIQSSVRLNLKVLAMLGLIQLVSHETAVTNNVGIGNYSSFLFYVNRRAKILDTTGSWPRTKLGVEELSYYFETPADVAKYWTDVYTISTDTEILISGRGRKQLVSPLRPANEVQTWDSGEIFGDGKGPCGFDSCFFMDIPRLWQTFYSRPSKKVVNVKKKIVSIKSSKLETKRKKKAKAPRPKKPVVEKPPVIVKRKKSEGVVKWSKHEDLLIMICKAAITIMSPNSQPGSLIVRNVVAKELISITDPRKTKGLCHTRASTIDSNITLIHEKQCILNELRRRRNLIQPYEGLLKKLRIKYATNMSKFLNKARLPMLELVWIILQVMRSKSYNEKLPCVALSLDEFLERFSITTSSANKLCNMYKVSENSPLKEAIIVTVMQTLDGELDSETAKKVYKIFERIPESALRIIVEQLRKCSAIAAKEKLFNNQFRKMDLEDIVQSSYKISVFYRRRWICRLNSDFADKVAAIIDCVEPENDIKGSPEMNCVACELETSDVMEIESTTVPVLTDSDNIPIRPTETSALLIDTKYSLKTGTMRLKNKYNVDIAKLYEVPDIKLILEELESYASLHIDEIQNSNIDTNDKILLHLKQKGEKGATFLELQTLGYDDKSLLDKLLQFEAEKVIRRVGFYENVIILTEHFKSWSARILDKYVVCTPWLKLESGIKVDVFMQWTGVVLNTIFEKPGCSLAYISDTFEFITYRAVQDICVFLNKVQCVTLKVAVMPEPDLFSDIDIEPVIIEFNPFYCPANILSFPTKNCLTRYATLRKAILK